jgi:catechol 2,3-dioxygenase-like lactoylglutathione lyase family enzyme
MEDTSAAATPAEADLAARQAFRECIQIGVVVRDLDRAVRFLSEVFGFGPWRMVTYPPQDRSDVPRTYRGQQAEFSHRIAFTSLGRVELELVEPLEGDSLLSEFLERHGEGLQHIRFNVPELEPVLAYLRRQGVEPLMTGAGLRPGTTWAHLDTAGQAGFTIEIMNVRD